MKESLLDYSIYRFLAGIASMKESEVHLKWLGENQQHILYYYGIKRIWLVITGNDTEKQILLFNSWNKLKTKCSLTD